MSKETHAYLKKKIILLVVLTVFATGYGETLEEVINTPLKKVSEDSKRLEDFIPIVLDKPNKINIHKVQGPNGLSNGLLRYFAPNFYKPLAAIFNSSIREGHVPNFCKMANIITNP